MDITVAREIITRAKQDDVYDGPMPDDDATIIAEAESLVTMAEQAWAKYIRGPEVESILKLAAAQNGGEPEVEEKEGASEAEPTDEHAPPETDGDEGQRTLQVVEKLTKMEPWEGYADDTVKNITEGINYFIEENPNEVLDILEHVWSFESTHKNRARILTHVQEAFGRAGGNIGTQKPEEDAGEPGDEPEEARTEGEDQKEGGAEGGTEREPQSAEEEGEPADAESESKSEVGAEGGEGGTGEPESSGKEGRDDGPDSGPSAYQKLVKGVEDELRRERLDVPQPPEEKAPELPWTWHEIHDHDLQDLHMRYSVLAYYKSYRLALHERIAQHCKEAADALHSERMVNISKYDEKGKEKKVGLIEAEIALDPHVKRWRVLQRKHEQLAAADKREMEAYLKIVESLSRLETMRHNAWERARR